MGPGGQTPQTATTRRPRHQGRSCRHARGAETAAPPQPGRPRSPHLPAPPWDPQWDSTCAGCRTDLCPLWVGPELPRPHATGAAQPQTGLCLWKVLGSLERTPCSAFGNSRWGKGSVRGKGSWNTKVSRPAHRRVPAKKLRPSRALPPGTLAPHLTGSRPKPVSPERLLLSSQPAAPHPRPCCLPLKAPGAGARAEASAHLRVRFVPGSPAGPLRRDAHSTAGTRHSRHATQVC